MPVDAKYIADCALDYANVPKIDRRIVASVHLENREDELFWDTILQRHHSGKYNYIYESRISKDSTPISGVNQCLKFKPYLSPAFFICIDSDLRYLLQEPDFDAGHYVLQTYTYSWENHYCLAEQVQQHIKELSVEASAKFDFVSFLHNLSSFAYNPLLYLLEALDLHLAPKSIEGQFNQCFPAQCPSSVFEDNGAQLLNDIQMKLQRFVSNPLFASIDFTTAKEKYHKLGLTEANTYLHLRGHNIFNMLNHIGNMLCRPYRIKFRDQILLPSLQQSGYWEMEKVIKDSHTILKLTDSQK